MPRDRTFRIEASDGDTRWTPPCAMRLRYIEAESNTRLRAIYLGPDVLFADNGATFGPAILRPGVYLTIRGSAGGYVLHADVFDPLTDDIPL